MASLSERLALIIDFNGAQAVKGLEGLAKQTERAEDKWDNASASLSKMGAAGLAASGVAATGLSKLAGKASDLNEVTSKTNVIFGDAADSVIAFAKDAGKALGQSETAALEAATGVAQMGKAAGFAGQDLADFSTDLVTLASDLASFNNTSPEEAITALGAALRGESEPIRAYGVLLDDATLKQRALSMGLIETTTGTLPPAIKVQAAYAEILAQTTDAQGDFARTSDGVANQQRILKAELDNLATGIGTGVLPMFTAIVSTGADVIGSLNNMGPAAQTALGSIAAGATGVIAALSGVSLVSGQLMKMRDRFTEVTDAGRKLTTAGKAAGALGLAVGGAAIAFALLSKNTDKSIISMRDFGKSADTQVIGKLKDVKIAFDDATRAHEENLRIYESSDDGTKALMDAVEIQKDLMMAQDDLNQVTKDFQKILAESPQFAQRFIDAAKAAGYETGEWQAKLDSHVDAVAKNKVATEEYREAIDEAAGTTVEMAESQEDAAKAAEEQAESLKDAEEAIKDANNAALDYLDTTIGLYEASLDYQGLLDHFPDKINDLREAHEEVTKAEKDHGSGSEELRQAHVKQADAIRGVQTGLIEIARRAEEAAVQQAGLEGRTLSAEERISAQRKALHELAAAHPEVKQAIDDYIINGLDPLLVKTEQAEHRGVRAARAARDAWIEAGQAVAGFERRHNVGGGVVLSSYDPRDLATTVKPGFGGAPMSDSATGGANVTINVNLSAPLVTQQAAQWVADQLAVLIRTNGVGALPFSGVTATV